MRCSKHQEKFFSHLVSIEPPLRSNLDKSLNRPRVSDMATGETERYLFCRSITIYASRIQLPVPFREYVDEVLSGFNGRHGYASSPGFTHVGCSLCRRVIGITIGNVPIWGTCKYEGNASRHLDSATCANPKLSSRQTSPIVLKLRSALSAHVVEIAVFAFAVIRWIEPAAAPL